MFRKTESLTLPCIIVRMFVDKQKNKKNRKIQKQNKIQKPKRKNNNIPKHHMGVSATHF